MGWIRTGWTGFSGVRPRASQSSRAIAALAIVAFALATAVPAVTNSSLADAAQTAGTISTIAGGAVPGPVPATSMGLSPVSVLADGDSFFVTDEGLSEVREVDSSGNDKLIAGNGTNASAGDDGPAASAALSPGGMALDKSGNLVILDGYNNRIRVVAESTGTFYGQSMIEGDIYTVVGNGTRGFSGDGGPATAAEFASPAGVAVDAFGNLVISDQYNDRIRVVAESTGTFYGISMTTGDIYTVVGNGTFGFSGDGGPATAAAFYLPLGVAVDGSGNLIVADSATIGFGWSRSRRVPSTAYP